MHHSIETALIAFLERHSAPEEHARGPCAHGVAGVVNGMQSSLQSLLQALSYAVGLVVWQPQLFVFLMAGSVLVVTAALAVYLYFIGAKEWLEEQISTQRQYQPMQATAQTEQACELTWQTDLPEKK